MNLPTEPLFVQGQGAQSTAASAIYPAAKGLDAQVMGLGAASLNSGSQNAVPVDMLVQGLNASGLGGVGLHTTSVDQVVRGQQGSTLVSVQTRPEAPQHAEGFTVSGATTTVIPGSAGKSIRLRRLTFQDYSAPSTGAYGNWQGTSGVNIWNFNLGQAGQFSHDFEGYALPAGDGLECVQSGGSVTLNGVVTWDQY